MMKLSDPSMALLAASGGDAVKLFNVSVESGDPCTLTYTPSPGFLVNSVKWNHTNLVVASAGEDKKISLWRKNGQSMGTIAISGTDSGDGIEESISAISFSNKGSRYICSGGSCQVVRIWDLQRKLCIKRLMGHTNTITGTMYNCKDDHLASISLSGDLLVHNLASGGRAAELKDPNNQVLRVLDYSRLSRHLLVTAGDDGSVHLWDTTGRHPKNSWLKQHSAPAAGVSFSPSNDKIIASVGLDKKLYTFDSGSRRSSSCISYEAPFSSLAFRDDGLVLAAGTSSGRVVFYDVRAKPQPFTVLRAYNSSEAVTSLCWQRSKPVVVNENCTAEMALLGGSVEDSILMPDPLPSMSSASHSEVPSLSRTGSGSTLPPVISFNEETPLRRPGGPLTRLKAPRTSYNFMDDMEVFSPLVEVQPITPSLDKYWDNHEGSKLDNVLADKKPSSFVFPSSSSRRFPFAEDGIINEHPIYDWKPSSSSRQDDSRSSHAHLSGSTPPPSSKSAETSITPPEAWGGGERFDKIAHLRQTSNVLPPRLGITTSSASFTSGGSMLLSGMQDVSSTLMNQTSMSSVTTGLTNARLRDVSISQETSIAYPEQFPSFGHLSTLPLGSAKSIVGLTSSIEAPSGLLASSSLARRFSTYAERISTTSSFSDGISLGVASPKVKKTGSETREDLLNSLSSRSESLAAVATEPGVLPLANGGVAQPHKALLQPSDMQQGSSFPLQLFQRQLEETLGTFGESLREDMRNVHIEVLRQFHMQECLYLEKQTEMTKQIESLQKEVQELRQLLRR
ncbi:unnamed protein product [Linum tenue]|uniref:Protein NEDD1 n=1 Tax=Linum tenue TaxID=586396 RepID=A0AAV0JU78_9ROSI|nr:unnamed protein product [Linum tenue]CAI0412151.1 unnamed protein product [Linum tenue]